MLNVDLLEVGKTVYHDQYGQLTLISWSESKKTLFGEGLDKKIKAFSVENASFELPRSKSIRDGGRKSLVLSDEKKQKLKEILQKDSNFRMPISAPPDEEDIVRDQIENAENGLTIASDRKLQTSWDTVCSANPEIESILKDSGAYTRPFFNSEDIVLVHGPRKAFYDVLLDMGFSPTSLTVKK